MDSSPFATVHSSPSSLNHLLPFSAHLDLLRNAQSAGSQSGSFFANWNHPYLSNQAGSSPVSRSHLHSSLIGGHHHAHPHHDDSSPGSAFHPAGSASPFGGTNLNLNQILLQRPIPSLPSSAPPIKIHSSSSSAFNFPPPREESCSGIKTESSPTGKNNLLQEEDSSPFKKGSLIELADGSFKRIQDMKTRDFLECVSRTQDSSPNLVLEQATISAIKIINSKEAMVTFVLGHQAQTQSSGQSIKVQVPLGHPFFVYNQGWSSLDPQVSRVVNGGLETRQLELGDTCLSLTNGKSASSSQSINKVLSSNGNGNSNSYFEQNNNNNNVPMNLKTKF